MRTAETQVRAEQYTSTASTVPMLLAQQSTAAHSKAAFLDHLQKPRALVV
jgi:hypothetical protein